MAKISRVRRCFHCGAILQTKAPKEPGYILAATIEANKPDALLYCNRCYSKIKALNYSELDLNVENDIKKILKDAVATDALLVWVVDLFAFSGNINPELVKLAKKLNIVVLGTKRDLFPRGVKDEALLKYLEERFSDNGLNPIEYHIFGSDGGDIPAEELIEHLNLLRKGHDVYMVGSITSGKTSIINRALKGFKNNSKWTITTETYKDTKAKVLEIPLSNSSFLYELPGFALTTSIVSKVEKDVAKLLTPRKSIKVTQRTLLKNETVLVGNLAQLTLVKGKATITKLYSAEGIEVKKVKTSQINEVTEENNRKRNIRPYSENFSEFTDYDVFEYEMDDDNKLHDINIEGLGWFTFVAKGQIIRVTLPKGCLLKEYPSKVKIDA